MRFATAGPQSSADHPSRRSFHSIVLAVVSISIHFAGLFESAGNAIRAEETTSARESDCSPVDLILTSDESHAVTVNQVANSISLVDLRSGKVTATAACGERPSNVAMTVDGTRVLATASYSGELIAFDRAGDDLRRVGSLKLGFEPRGVAISPDGKLAYVALSTASAIAVVDIAGTKEQERITVGRWPRFLALSPDGKRLAVGCSGDGGVSVVDTETRKQLYIEEFSGLNLGQMQISNDGKYVYFPWIVYRHNPITPENIRRGWILASRIARVRLDKASRREAIALDPRGEAIGDPHGMALSPDEKTLVCAASGTHELLVYKLPGLPFQDYGGPGDHIDPALLKDRARFHRIPLGGRPMAVRYSKTRNEVYVANYLLNAIQIVDMDSRKVVRSIELSPRYETTLARKGETIFYDAARSLDQWYSCHSCHYEGHTNAVSMDTRNDGRFGNFKTVLSLRESSKTGPWFWHGWSTDFRASLKKSMTDTMLGKAPTDQDVEAVAAFVETLSPPPNPLRESGRQDPLAERGEKVFQSEKAGCSNCHPSPLFTDGKKHDVGLGSKDDVYEDYNTPSLHGVYDRVRYLHDGRAGTLEEVLTGPHNPASVTGLGELSKEELDALLAYLRSI